MIAAQSHFSEPFVRLLLCLLVILVLGKLVGALCRRIGVPVVIGEIVAGIALGPSLLGQLPGHLDTKLFPVEVRPDLKLVASLGLVLFMFVVGLEVDMDVVRRSGRRALAISLTSIALPFALGMGLLGPYLHRGEDRCVVVQPDKLAANKGAPCDTAETAAAAKKAGNAERSKALKEIAARHAEEEKRAEASGTTYVLTDEQKAADAQTVDARVADAEPKGRTVQFAGFALFLGVSMCGTAFPVLARILAERNMFKIPLGILLVACAAIDDIMAFTLLALSTAVANGRGAGQVVVMLAELALFVAVLFVVVRPLLERFVVSRYRTSGRMAPEHLAILLTGLLASSYVTSIIGVHELIGAFLFGVSVPRRHAEGLFHAVAERLDGVSVQLLLPVFFVIAGQGVNLKGLSRHDVLPTVAILAVACVGKFVGGATAARVTGVPRRQSYAIGTLMNTRGLAELVILQVGRDAGAINDKVYTMLVIMAVVTTAMAGPLLKLVYPDRWLQRDIAEAERSGGGAASDRAVVLVDDPATAEPLVDLAIAFGGARPTSSVTLVRFVPASAGFAGVADALGETQELRRRVEAAGVGCTVVSRASADPAGDTLAEVRRIAPDAVLTTPRTDGLVPRLVEEGPDVVEVAGRVDASGGVAAPGGSGDDERAALELAVRLALRHDVPLQVRGEGARLGKQLRRLGVRRGDGALAIGDAGPVKVSAGARDRVSLTERLGRWRVGDVVEPLANL